MPAGNGKRNNALRDAKNFFSVSPLMFDGVDISVISDREINIDGCVGIEEYSDKTVMFSGKNLKIVVFGDDLELYTYTGGRIKASGRIRRIEYIRGDDDA